jgi:hypothetical protein
VPEVVDTDVGEIGATQSLLELVVQGGISDHAAGLAGEGEFRIFPRGCGEAGLRLKLAVLLEGGDEPRAKPDRAFLATSYHHDALPRVRGAANRSPTTSSRVARRASNRAART